MYWFVVYAGSMPLICVQAKYDWLACHLAARITEYAREGMTAFLM